ncbi:MAG: hypothetical protein AAF658_19630, partial [Myxococcota bacterium]
ESDGVVFTRSQQHVEPYLNRGAQRGEQHHFPDLAHTETPVASAQSADELQAAIDSDPIRFGHLNAIPGFYRDQDSVKTVFDILRG